MPATIQNAIGMGRGITQYNTRCDLETKLQAQFRIKSDTEYRQLLQKDPARFDAAVKSYVPAEPFFPISPCADAKTMKYM